jgi:hypothetical protein
VPESLPKSGEYIAKKNAMQREDMLTTDNCRRASLAINKRSSKDSTPGIRS